jgi:hypothetical protein
MPVCTILREGRFTARCDCIEIARHKQSFGGTLCLIHKIFDSLLGLDNVTPLNLNPTFFPKNLTSERSQNQPNS